MKSLVPGFQLWGVTSAATRLPSKWFSRNQRSQVTSLSPGTTSSTATWDGHRPTGSDRQRVGVLQKAGSSGAGSQREKIVFTPRSFLFLWNLNSHTVLSLSSPITLCVIFFFYSCVYSLKLLYQLTFQGILKKKNTQKFACLKWQLWCCKKLKKHECEW